jgi:FAD/FMN-containing dehydrogenase
MNHLHIQELKIKFRGELDLHEETLNKYSHDASLLEIKPTVVSFPKDSADVRTLVDFVLEKKDETPELSLTARAAGTCMSGGSINESFIVDTTRYMNEIKSVTKTSATVQPGVFYRDLEERANALGVMLPSYTASKDICAVGGMFGNNSGGEKTLKYGKTEDYILATKTVLGDAKEYIVKPLSSDELAIKCSEETYEGRLYKTLRDFILKNQKEIYAAKPKVSKNSAGYYLWNIWDRETGIFDLNKLLVGSQGTLGITTEITFKLVPKQTNDKMLVLFLPELSHLGELVTELLKYSPDSLESYDDESIKLAVKFFPDMVRQMGIVETLKLGLRFLPEALMLIRKGLPKLVLIVEFTGISESELTRKVHLVQDKIRHFGYETRIPKTDADEKKYWKIRHESFNLLRKHVSGKRTAPFIDDVIVSPEHLPEFLPKLQAMLEEYNMIYTVAGHAGNGNFHIIPLMDMSNPQSIQIIDELSDRVYALVHEYGGSITAEHNDGIIRTPYIEQMFGKHVYGLFKETKNIFDPKNIFNPNKKVGATKEYMMKHIRREKKK